ncbi:Alpha/Beta hydrolase protein [Blyttiomyces helicus]|uniref:Alpha/Beta hydrolase protein n=1 Tax=Blyttiomyces helicus TaxID=388810 RepID=A0A4P9VZC3_9FUNG|nr:Alpha/Beta hydrolase protein [Blyttiomyces helicus]|eukprot:RKO84133.1 Alpha/Beta hydrolase protein [Blyttiomyces helicus]
MPLSPEALTRFRAFLTGAIEGLGTPPHRSALADHAAHVLTEHPDVIHITDGPLDALLLSTGAAAGRSGRIERIREGDRVVLYLHGGGWCIGNEAFSLDFLKNLSAVLDTEGVDGATHFVVAAYPLAPENPFPASPHAVLEIYKAWWKIASSQIIIAGDSAGANLSIALLNQIASQPALGLSPPRAVIAISPAVDISLTKLDPPDADIVTQEVIRTFHAGYAGASADAADADARIEALAADPLASPVRAASTKGWVSDALVLVGGAEVFRGESVKFAGKLKADGAAVTLVVEDGMEHVWVSNRSDSEEGKKGLRDIARFIKALK